MSDEDIYRWNFLVETTDVEDRVYLNDDEFVGTRREAEKEAKRLADEYELEYGALVTDTELERRGRA